MENLFKIKGETVRLREMIKSYTDSGDEEDGLPTLPWMRTIRED